MPVHHCVILVPNSPFSSPVSSLCSCTAPARGEGLTVAFAASSSPSWSACARPRRRLPQWRSRRWSRLTWETWSSCPRWLAQWSACTTERPSTRWKSRWDLRGRILFLFHACICPMKIQSVMGCRICCPLLLIGSLSHSMFMVGWDDTSDTDSALIISIQLAFIRDKVPDLNCQVSTHGVTISPNSTWGRLVWLNTLIKNDKYTCGMGIHYWCDAKSWVYQSPNNMKMYNG